MKPHEIGHYQVLSHQAEIALQLDPSLLRLSEHFSVQSLLPGVTQLNWATDYATTLLVPGWHLHSIQNVKFQSPLLSEAAATLNLSWQEMRQMFSFGCQRHDGDVRHIASSGKTRLCR